MPARVAAKKIHYRLLKTSLLVSSYYKGRTLMVDGEKFCLKTSSCVSLMRYSVTEKVDLFRRVELCRSSSVRLSSTF